MIWWVIALWIIDQIIGLARGLKITILTLIFDLILWIVVVWLVTSIYSFYMG